MSPNNETINTMSALNEWEKEGFIFACPDEAGDTVVHEFLNQNSGAYFYTASEEEKKFITENRSDTYSYIGACFNAYSQEYGKNNGKLAVIRYYNTSTKAHVYSADASEQSFLNESLIHTNEGIAWYADFI